MAKKPTKKASKKTAPGANSGAKNSKNKMLNWTLPGGARSTLQFSDSNSFKGILVTLMPGFEAQHARNALIGDDITGDDLMDIDHFEAVFPKLPKDRQFVRTIFVNRSDRKIDFELAFDFGGTDERSQRYKYSIDKNSTLKDRIPVKLLK